VAQAEQHVPTATSLQELLPCFVQDDKSEAEGPQNDHLLVSDRQANETGLARRQHASPRFFFALASEKPQVMPQIEQHRLGLTLELFEQ
jgi:hypothetical protein